MGNRQDLFDQVAHAVVEICQMAGNKAGSRAGIAHMGVAAISGAVQVLAASIGQAKQHDTSEEARRAAGKAFDPMLRVTNESALFGLLWTAAAMDIHHIKKDGDLALQVEVDIGPESQALACQWYQKITGKSPDGFVDSVYLECARDQMAKEAAGAQAADALLTELMGARPVNDRPA